MKKILTLIVLCSFVFAPVASAQTEGDAPSPAPVAPVVEPVAATPESSPAVAPEEPAPEDTPAIAEVPADSAPAEEPGSSQSATDPTVVQDTATSQESAPSETLENPVDPTIATSTESEVIVISEEVATSTEEIATSTATTTPVEVPVVVPEEQPAPEQIEIPIDIQQDLQIVAAELSASQDVVEPEVAQRTRLEPDVEPSYVFALSGKKIPTKLAPGKASADAVTTTIDPTSNTVNVSGSCSDVYFVVLLYRNAGDYETDPASYIVNRAYPCENGAYSYSINDVPATIQNGTYYLLIGEQGNKGSWRPASALTEIVINRSN